jgi:hypothetical protein
VLIVAVWVPSTSLNSFPTAQGGAFAIVVGLLALAFLVAVFRTRGREAAVDRRSTGRRMSPTYEPTPAQAIRFCPRCGHALQPFP